MRSMKVVYAALIFAALSGSNVFAKGGSDMAAGFQLGANFGSLNVTSTTSSATLSTSNRTGFLFGGQFEMKLADMFYLAPGLQYSQKGGKLVYANVGTYVDKFNFLEIPIYGKLKFMDGESFRPFLFAGPAFGFLMSASAEFTPTTGSVVTTDVKSALNSLDFSLDFGGGAEFDVSDGMAAYLQLGYSLGLSNLDKVSTTSTTKTQTFQIIAGMNFAI